MADLGDLRVPPGPGAPRGLVVPAVELIERFSHASGPGGQGVNTADSRVQLSLDLGTTTAPTDAQPARALAVLAPRLAGTVLRVDSAGHRAQRRVRHFNRSTQWLSQTRRAQHVHAPLHLR